MKSLQFSLVSLCVLAACQNALADTANTEKNSQTAQTSTKQASKSKSSNPKTSSETLDEIQVVEVNRTGENITDLGKVIKTAKTLAKEQVMGIRDLSRYNPGVYATEQGRGATTGYTIRGVDQNRVGIVVDGIPQAQSVAGDFKINGKILLRSFDGSGARNEVELENISQAEINKGSNSAQSGSGALGGAVNFTTKNVNNILTEGEKFGGVAKTGYSSKNGQFMQSLATAFRHNGFEGMVQYTHRDGHETRSHKGAYVDREAERFGWYINKYNVTPDRDWEESYKQGKTVLKDVAPNSLYEKPFYLDNCTENCGPFYAAEATVYPREVSNLLYRERTPEEQAQIDSMWHKTEHFSAQDYTGPDRGLPDPQRNNSHSWLARLGYRPNENHYIGFILEDTKQKYWLRDMATRAFYAPSEACVSYRCGGMHSYPYYTYDPYEGVFPLGQWTNTAFSTENHHKTRQGLSYIYNGGNKWVDRFEANADIQTVKIDSLYKKLNCSRYPNVDEHCQPSADKLGSRREIYQAENTEKHKRFNIKYNKFFNVLGTEHLFTLATGIDHYSFTHNKVSNTLEYRNRNYKTEIRDGKIYFQNLPSEATFSDNCEPLTVSVWRAPSRTIQPYCHVSFKGRNRYLSLRDNIKITKYLDLGGQVRWDVDSLQGNYAFLKKAKYKNTSWNAEAVLHPFSFLDIAYRDSSGFRIPNVVEYFSPSLQGFPEDLTRDIKPERSRNQEAGLTLKGGWGYLETTYFRTKYRDLITLGSVRRSDEFTYYNFSNMDLVGLNIQGHFNFNGIWSKIPEGYSLDVAYGRSKAKKVERVNDQLEGILYSLDGIQPPRTVIGFNYDSPSQRWGVSAIVTHSRSKRLDETIYTEFGRHCQRINYKYTCTDSAEYKSTKDGSQSWTTLDLISYVNLPHNITLRAGVYNVFNRQYSNWEAVRQGGIGSVHRHNDVVARSYDDPTKQANLARYTAPGRNYVLNFEMKF